MELKLLHWVRRTKNKRVLIVPLWNWNRTTVHRLLPTIHVLIVPLWNWNQGRRIYNILLSLVLIVPLWNWNQLRRLCSHAARVLIVPLWNWNTVIAARMLRFNRTFMELKFLFVSVVSKTSCFNRTFMELKLDLFNSALVKGQF